MIDPRIATDSETTDRQNTDAPQPSPQSVLSAAEIAEPALAEPAFAESARAESATQAQNGAPRIAEVIAIGDEMTGGARVDTNSAWIATRLQSLGYEVRYHAMVGDDFEDCVNVFRHAAVRSDVAVCTGGLGPTRDDLTREALAAASGVELELDPDSLAHIESLFSARQREMPPRNRQQAMFPVGSRVIFNPQGTAPGVDIVLKTHDSDRPCRVFALPGVPAEMKQMFDQHVITQLTGESGATVIATRVMKFFGVGESDMESLLGEMIARGRNPRVGITVTAATISLRLTAIGSDQPQCDAALRQCGDEILQRAGQYYFGEGEDYEQYHAVNDHFTNADQRFAVIEFGNEAPLASWFASIESKSTYVGGIHFRHKADLLTLAGTDSLELACQNLASVGRIDHLIIVDRYPSLLAEDGKPLRANDVELSLFSDSQMRTTKVSLGGHPSIVQPRIAKAALLWTRQSIADMQRCDLAGVGADQSK